MGPVLPLNWSQSLAMNLPPSRSTPVENVLKMGLAIRISMENIQTKPLCGWLWEETHVQKVVGSNPSTLYWMENFHIYLCCENCNVWKDENEQKEAGDGPFFKKTDPFL